MPELEAEDVDRAVAALGSPLLEFLCAGPVNEVAAIKEVAADVISAINAVLVADVEGRIDAAAMGEYLRYRLGEIVNGEVLALSLHKQAGGVVGLAVTSNAL